MINAGWYARVHAGFALLASLLLVACGEPFSVWVTTWKVGSADVAGTIINQASGCTDPEITLKFYDHNDALVSDWSFGAGELASGQSRSWRTHMWNITNPDQTVEANVTRVSASAECLDQH